MRIRYIKAKNFLSFKDVEIPLDNDLNIIVGPNNSGKTNVARALKLVADIIDNKKGEYDLLSFLHDPNERYFRLEIGYELSEEEKQDIIKFIDIYINSYNYSELDPKSVDWNEVFNVREYVTLKELAKELKKLKGESIGDDGRSKAIDTREMLKFNRYIFEIFKDSVTKLLKLITELISIGSIILEFRPYESIDPYILFKFDGEVVFVKDDIITSRSWSAKTLRDYFIKYIKDLTPQPILNEIREFLSGYKDKFEVPEFDIDVKAFLSKILRFSGLHTPRLEYSKLSSDHKAIISDIAKKYRIKFGEGYIIDLLYLILKIFSTRLIILKEIRGEPKKVFSFEDLRKTSEIATQVYKGTGSDLALSLLGLKDSENKKDRDNYGRIRKIFKDLTGFDFDVSCNLNEQKVIIWIQSRDRQFLLDYVGSGFLEILNILRAVIGNKDYIIVLDEPAAHLHPSKQLDLLDEIKSEAMGNNNQLIIITHSPYFISSDNIKNVMRFQIKNGQTEIYKPQKPDDSKLEDPKLSRIFDNPRFKSALFSNGVLLVEGVSEALSLPYFLKKLGFDLEDQNIEIISAIGDTGFDKYVQVLDQFGIPWVIVCDGKAITHLSRGCEYLPKVFCQLNADKLEPSDRERIVEIVKGKTNYNEFKDDELDELIEIAKKYNVFAFKDADFIDFLKRKFEDEFNQVLAEFELSGKKPEIALILAQRLPSEKVRKTSEFKELIELIKQTFNLF